jgi:hypothetical protein
VTAYGILGESKDGYEYLGFTNADDESGAVEVFVNNEADEEIEAFHSYLAFNFEDSAQFTAEEVRDMTDVS